MIDTFDSEKNEMVEAGRQEARLQGRVEPLGVFKEKQF